MSERRSSRGPITFNGKTQSLKAWSRETGISYSTLKTRLNRYAWPIDRALTEPVGTNWDPSWGYLGGQREEAVFPNGKKKTNPDVNVGSVSAAQGEGDPG